MRFGTVTLFILIHLFSFHSASAQNEHVFRFDGLPVMDGNDQCGILKVVDMRVNRADLGYVRKGPFNRYTPVVTEKPLDHLLQDSYDRMKGSVVNTTDELILVLYSLEFQDKPNGEELGTFYFDGDFYRGNNGGYRLLATVDSMYEMRSPWDVTGMLMKCGQGQIATFLTRYAIMQPTQAAIKTYAIDQLKDRRKNEKMAYPIYTQADFRKGVYYTVEQFLNGTPIDTPFTMKTYTRTGGAKATYFHYDNSKGRKGERIKENSFFAIYDGAAWWIGNSNYSTPMKYLDGDFYASKYFRQAYAGNDGSAAVSAGVMFGLAGYLLATAIPEGGEKACWGVYTARFNPFLKIFTPIKRTQ